MALKSERKKMTEQWKMEINKKIHKQKRRK